MSDRPGEPVDTAASAATTHSLYYGWVLVGALALTETVSYGILQYAFPVFLGPMGRELGWSKTAMTGAFSLAALVSGLAAIPVGRWVDRRGARLLMTMGSVAATLLVIAWAGVRSLPAFYVVWTLMGLAMAGVLYDPAFAVIANWFDRLRGRALTVLTFVAGFASVIFVPLATWLVHVHGWRAALLWLAAILAVLTVVPHALLLRRRPADLGLVADGGALPGKGMPAACADSWGMPAAEAVRSASFRWLAVAFGLSSVATGAVSVHLIPYLLERGYPPAFTAAAMGGIGLMALPGRLVFTPLGSRWPRSWVTASIFALQVLGIAVLLAGRNTWSVWLFVALFGAGFGAISPARAALVAEFYGTASYGRITGVLALITSLTRAIAPVGASLLYTATGGYAAVWAVLVATAAVAAMAVLWAGDGPSPILVPSPS